MPHRRKQNIFMLIAFVMGTVIPVISVAAEKAQPEKMPAGQANYEEFCAACHGYDGIPVLPGTPNFSIGERLDKQDDVLLQVISKGKGDVMPPWGGVLSENSQQDVLDYIIDVIHKKISDNNK